CELHVYEKRFDTRGEKVLLRAGTKSELAPPKEKSHRACLVLTRHYGFGFTKQLQYTELEVQSRHIIKALREVIGTYRGVDFASKPVSIREPPRCLFHYQDELRRYAEASDNQQLKSHLRLCLQYMEKTLHKEIKIFQSLSKLSSPEIDHCHLWMVFKPGILVYEKEDGIERLSRLRSIVGEEEDDSYELKTWHLLTERIHHIGSGVGLAYHKLKIDRYEGRKPVCELTAVPLHLHPESERIRHDLLERGRKFLSLCRISHCFYDGVAHMCYRVSPQDDETSHTNVCAVKRIPCPEFAFGTKIYRPLTEANSDALFSDEEIMTCHQYLPGFSLELKKWGLFSVADIQELAYNDQAFHGLVLSAEKKKLISSLVGDQSFKGDDGFDDLIRGKGKGLIFLLHGPPGVGKTYTAESIADHTRRPLLKISSAELSGPAYWIELELSRLFSLSTRWNSIMLMDEADVFMQERSLNNLEINWLVSTLLRVLEYYEGILFLTTNRVETIDPAFMSRIHLSISYPRLSVDSRRELWKSAILRATRGQAPEWLTTEFLAQLVEKEINGREIKNIVRIGHALARQEQRSMTNNDLVRGLEALKQFEIDFSE
ncbi:P-loop containing nucleoside triphosphate hydrolase protein, partial [Hyaloscypha hepaticicola]